MHTNLLPTQVVLLGTQLGLSVFPFHMSKYELAQTGAFIDTELVMDGCGWTVLQLLDKWNKEKDHED